MLGVINVRGSAVPAVDFRSRFGVQKTEPTIDTRIIIIEIPVAGEAITVDAIADAVDDVPEIDAVDMDGAGTMEFHTPRSVLKGTGKREASFIMILGIAKLLFTNELNHMADVDETPDRSRDEAPPAAAAG